jgi:lipopolysaccharide biosynthesis glycosyltransferase
LVTPLKADTLAASGLLRRSQDHRGGIYDLHSNAPCATEFAISRFLVPHLAQKGWALFVDSDVVFVSDVAELFALADPRYAVMCVKHSMPDSGTKKMDGQVQTRYPRKNWSSVMLINADHPANRRLSLQDVNERPGRDLHAFYWLHDDEIGSLPKEWNVLVGVDDMPEYPKILHWTLGTPELNADAPYAHLWHAA